MRMRKIATIGLLAPLLALLACGLLRAQNVGLTFSRSVYLNKTSVRPVNSPKVDFVNLNEERYYYDKRLKKKIDRAENKRIKDYAMLDSLYSYYVQHFGIRNFHQAVDLEMVWRLGQIKEILNDTTLAMFYYAIALKNQFRRYDEIKLYYDALRSTTFNDYVELDYYYKLIRRRMEVDTISPPRGVLLNMGDDVNTRFPEYAPYMHPSNDLLIFTSRRNERTPTTPVDYGQNEDLYYIKRDPIKRRWGEALKFPPEISSSIYNEGSASLHVDEANPDSATVYFVRCNAENSVGGCDLYEARIHFDAETGAVTARPPRNLGPNINSRAWDSHPCIAENGNTLFFASNRSGGFGRIDLYVAKRVGGEWLKTENLGPVVNTNDDEVSPFFHPMNKTLYFSSKGHILNFGGFDIYKSAWLGDGWQEPVNVGPFVNSEKDENYFTLSSDGDSLVYASDTGRVSELDDVKNFDLYSFHTPMGARPDALVAVKGYLVDSATRRPLTGIVMARDLEDGSAIEPIYINEQGYFEFQLVNGRNYALYIFGDDAIRIKQNDIFNSDSLFTLMEYGVAENKNIILESIEFSSGSAEVDKQMQDELDLIANFLTENRGRKLVVRGHTDSDGDRDDNLKLSQRRAQSIKEYLLQKTGLGDTAITAVGMGSTQPVYPNEDEESKAKNRRVEFELIPAFDEIQDFVKPPKVEEVVDYDDEFLPEGKEGDDEMLDFDFDFEDLDGI